MKVLMLNYEYPPVGGGAGNANYYLLKELAKKDIEIDLLTCSKSRFEIEELSPRIRVHKLDIGKKGMHYWTCKEMMLWTLKAYFYSRNLVRKKRYDLCHSWFGWPTGWIAYMLGIPYIIALRGSDVPGYNVRLKNLDGLVFRPLSKVVWKKAKRVIANSQGLMDLARKTSKREIIVIPNGIDTNEFKPKRKTGKLTLVSAGRLIERKGYHKLIPQLSGLDVKLVLAGEGKMISELKSLSRKHKIDVDFLGMVPHERIAAVLSDADVFVLPSSNEGMSNSLLEAMASGLAVVVTDVGGTRELVKGNGFVVPVFGFREALGKYINSPDLLKEHKKRSREIALKMNWKNVVLQYLKVYDVIRRGS